MNVSLILGAGFSAPAGIPQVKGISSMFKQADLEEQIVCYQSSEWGWKKFASKESISTCYYHEFRLPVGCILKNLIDTYCEENNNPLDINYEEFYQWVDDLVKLRYSEFEIIKRKVQNALKFSNPSSSSQIEFMPDSILTKCIFHLIEELLYIREPMNKIHELYKPYINLFTTDHEIDIYTFNHDLLLERLCEHSGLKISNGFSTGNSTLWDDHEGKIPIFDNTYNERIGLYKLHGSIDQYKFNYLEQANVHKKFDYFKTGDYYAKHWAKDIDSNGNIIQKFNSDITPQFVTGKNKFKIIQADKMYKPLYDSFEKNLPKSDKLIIVGYSYSDVHINKVIMQSKDSIKEIININPTQNFQYLHSNVTNIDPRIKPIVLI